MIPNQWYPILESKKLKPNKKPIGVRRLGKNIVLWRDSQAAVHALPDRCSHRAAKLSLGQVKDDCIECPYHGWQFNGHGKLTCIPSNPPESIIPDVFHIDPLTITEYQGLIWLWYGQPEAKTDTPKWFPDITDRPKYCSEQADVFPVNYLRIMENVTDFHHLAFVHKRLGLKKYKRLNQYSSTLDGDVISVDVLIQTDKEADKQSDKGFRAQGQILMPCLFALYLKGQLLGIGSATPVDENNTWFFVRYSQAVVNIPIVGQIMAWLSMVGDFYIAQKLQDLKIWQSQWHPNPQDTDHYHLIKPDQGFAIYRRERERLINEHKEANKT